jgi:hypothetical protein
MRYSRAVLDYLGTCLFFLGRKLMVYATWMQNRDLTMDEADEAISQVWLVGAMALADDSDDDNGDEGMLSDWSHTIEIRPCAPEDRN